MATENVKVKFNCVNMTWYVQGLWQVWRRGVLVVTLEVIHLEVVGVDEVKLCPCCECSGSRGTVPVTSDLRAMWR
jgi:hypothetical protein